MRGYYIIDGDSITGRIRSSVFKKIISSNITPFKAFIAAKNEVDLNMCCQSFKDLDPLIEVTCKKVGSFANQADAYCIYYAGKYTEEIVRCNVESQIYILSQDKLVLSIASEIQQRGINLVIPKSPVLQAINYTNNKTTTIDLLSNLGVSTITTKAESIINVPSWYSEQCSGEENPIGLACMKVGSEAICKKPEFIPFTRDLSNHFTIGNAGDISLRVWDVSNGLYAKNVEFRYDADDEVWKLRSLKGMRRKNREISINGNVIDASSGDHVINTGDTICMGVFKFIFKTNEREELIRYVSAEQLMIKIEKRFKQFAESTPSLIIPEYVREELTIGGITSWENAYIKHYRKLISANWEDLSVSNFRQYFVSNKDFNNRFVRLNLVRNKIMHPSKEPINEEEKQIVVDFYIATKALIIKHTKA